MEEEEPHVEVVAASAPTPGAAGGLPAAHAPPSAESGAAGQDAAADEAYQRFVVNRRTAMVAESLSLSAAPPERRAALREQRAKFSDGNLVDEASGMRIGLSTRPGRVVHGTVDGEASFVLTAEGRPECFAVRETIREALYGEVARAILVERVEGVAFRTVWAEQDGGRSTVDFAIKRVALEQMVNQSSAGGDLMQEDPIKEVAVQQLLSDPPCDGLGTPRLVLRDMLNLYLVMPFRGVELFQVITDRDITPAGRFDEATAKHCFVQLIEAIANMHSKGVAHLDVSLENVLLERRTFRCTLIDFGLARSIDRPLPRGEGVDAGFPARALMPTNKFYYIAPEINQGQPFKGTRVDLWAAAAMLFIMLTGTPLFDSASSACKKYRYLRRHGPAKLFERLKADRLLSAAAIDLLSRMFEVDPEKRLTLGEIRNHPWYRGA